MILYFSGTGNSKYVAQRMAEALDQSLLSMNDRIRSHDTSPVEADERLVIVTPTYAWRIPRLVRDWLLETEFPGAAQVWFIMTCGSEIGHASRYNRSLWSDQGPDGHGDAQIIMPRTTSPCLTLRRRRKPDASWPRPSRISTVLSPPSGRAPLSPAPRSSL